MRDDGLILTPGGLVHATHPHPEPRRRLVRRWTVTHAGDTGSFPTLLAALAWIMEHPGSRVTLTSSTHWEGPRAGLSLRIPGTRV